MLRGKYRDGSRPASTFRGRTVSLTCSCRFIYKWQSRFHSNKHDYSPHFASFELMFEHHLTSQMLRSGPKFRCELLVFLLELCGVYISAVLFQAEPRAGSWGPCGHCKHCCPVVSFSAPKGSFVYLCWKEVEVCRLGESWLEASGWPGASRDCIGLPL